MTEFEKIELALRATELYAEFQHYCHGRSTCIGCVYKITDVCSVIGPQEFIMLLGFFLKANNYRAILKKLQSNIEIIKAG